MNQRTVYATRADRSRGFSTLELLLVMVVSLVIAALSIPGFNQVRRTLRISGDARDLNGALNQAKMMAAADFTETRVYVDLGANIPNTFHIDVWNKALNCWQTVGDDPNVRPCFVPGASVVQYLSPGVTFGFGGVGAPPLNTQAAILQGTAQRSCALVNGKRVGQPVTAACIQFTSRGIPIDINTSQPTGNGAFYIQDNSQVYGVTVGGTGLSQVWATSVYGTANWYHK